MGNNASRANLAPHSTTAPYFDQFHHVGVPCLGQSAVRVGRQGGSQPLGRRRQLGQRGKLVDLERLAHVIVVRRTAQVASDSGSGSGSGGIVSSCVRGGFQCMAAREQYRYATPLQTQSPCNAHRL